MNFYYNPARLYWGEHCLNELKTEVQNLQAKHILLIKWSEQALENTAGEEMYQSLAGCQVSELVFSKSNPDIQDLYEVYTQHKNDQPDLIIAIGGGSVLDMAKSLAAILNKEYSSVEALREAIASKSTGTPECPWIGVPTTAGTGSEVTCWATVWDSEKNAKLSLEHHGNYAYAAFVDPLFTVSMPLQLVVSSALDAVAHATESYWSKAQNMVSDIYALKAISMIMENLKSLIETRDKKYYLAMAEASMLAGRAFSNTRTTACHSISYPLTLGYRIPHGVAVSMLLPSLLCVNWKTIPETEPLLKAYGVNSPEEAGEKIHKLLALAGISYHLSDWKVEKEQLGTIAGHCFTKGRMENNPVDLSKEDVMKILEAIW